MNEMYRSFVSGFCSHDNIEVAGSGTGPLVGLGFAVKDIIDVAGQTTGAGNPDWYNDHAPATRHARAVQQLLDAGANMVGKTITEEFAYGLIGENYHYGTPVNPRVVGGVPGGSSSGSASVVASGQADFALGTDTGGSVRVPASFCGLYGIRPSHGRVSLTGIMPLAPSLDTCGWFTRDAELLRTIGTVLLDESLALAPQRILAAEDAFDLADEDVRMALESAIKRVQECYGDIQIIRPSEMAGLQDYDVWRSVMQITRGSEAASAQWWKGTWPGCCVMMRLCWCRQLRARHRRGGLMKTFMIGCVAPMNCTIAPRHSRACRKCHCRWVKRNEALWAWA